MNQSFIKSLIIGCIGAIVGGFIVSYFSEKREIIISEKTPVRFTNYNDAVLSGQLQRQFISSSPTQFINAAEAATPAVVNVKAINGGNFSLWNESRPISISNGSGVIISPDGYVVTNRHVIDESSDIEITLNDKRDFKAKLIGSDPATDIALLKIEGKNFKHIVLGNSDSLRVGEWVLAVGNPFNLKSTVTAGIVSAKGRSIDLLESASSIESFIQTDAAVNPGNSGGALVNTNGELIGINTAIVTRSGRYEGYSFAIPSNLVLKVVNDLREYGEVKRGVLGLTIGDVTYQDAKRLNLYNSEGALIKNITSGGAADEAGLLADDLVLVVNGNKVTSVPAMQEILARYRPGSRVEIEYLRGGKLMKAGAVLRSSENDIKTAYSKPTILDEFGFELRDMTKKETLRLGTKGVFVSAIIRGSRIERTNMDPGFIILRVNETTVENLEECIHAMEKVNGKVLLEGIYEHHPEKFYYAFAR